MASTRESPTSVRSPKATREIAPDPRDSMCNLQDQSLYLWGAWGVHENVPHQLSTRIEAQWIWKSQCKIARAVVAFSIHKCSAPDCYMRIGEDVISAKNASDSPIDRKEGDRRSIGSFSGPAVLVRPQITPNADFPAFVRVGKVSEIRAGAAAAQQGRAFARSVGGVPGARVLAQVKDRKTLTPSFSDGSYARQCPRRRRELSCPRRKKSAMRGRKGEMRKPPPPSLRAWQTLACQVASQSQVAARRELRSGFIRDETKAAAACWIAKTPASPILVPTAASIAPSKYCLFPRRRLESGLSDADGRIEHMEDDDEATKTLPPWVELEYR
ncbi:hypothetical protein BOTBODRAFT_145947, partial [Botryobasidium botryosum FD-172 SS1]